MGRGRGVGLSFRGVAGQANSCTTLRRGMKCRRGSVHNNISSAKMLTRRGLVSHTEEEVLKPFRTWVWVWSNEALCVVFWFV